MQLTYFHVVCFCLLVVLLLVGIQWIASNNTQHKTLTQHYVWKKIRTAIASKSLTPPPNTLTSNKIIWSYWNTSIESDDPTVSENKWISRPFSVDLSIYSWMKYQPDYTICFLSDRTVGLYVDMTQFPESYPIMIPAHKADVIRLAVLEKYGGVWIDASMIMCKPMLDIFLDSNSNSNPNHQSKSPTSTFDIGGFTIVFGENENESVLENWLIATQQPQNRLIKKWKSEFYKAIEEEYQLPQTYIKTLKEKGINLKSIASPGYLVMHCALESILQSTPNNYFIIKSFSVRDEVNGPFLYAYRNQWNVHRAIQYLLNDHGSQDLCAVKLVGSMRREFDDMWHGFKPGTLIDHIV